MKFMRSSFLLAVIVFCLFASTICSSPPSIHKIPLRLSTEYVYYATLGFGTNKQEIQVLVDTGSQNIAIFCDICVQDCPLNQQFKTTESKNYKDLTCDAVSQFINEPHSASIAECLGKCMSETNTYQCNGRLDYGEGDLASYIKYKVSHDSISLSSAPANTFQSTFGCIYESRNFEQGIWGLSLKSADNILDQVFKVDKSRGLPAAKLFTICTNSTDTILNIGGVDQKYHIGQGISIGVDKLAPQWWKLNQNQIGAITIGKHVIRRQEDSFGEIGIILDSGTDFIILPSVIVTNLRNQIDSLCNDKAQICSSTQPVQLFQAVYKLKEPHNFFANLPTISVVINGKTLQTPISNYFWKLTEDVWALGVVRAEKYGFPMSILGAIWMNNFDIVFDRTIPQITIHDINRCSGPLQSRLLTTESDTKNEYDPYELPKQRQQFNTYASLSKLKVKYESSIRKLQKNK